MVIYDITQTCLYNVAVLVFDTGSLGHWNDREEKGSWDFNIFIKFTEILSDNLIILH